MCLTKDNQITNTVINNTIDLVKYLMEKYNISFDHVVRHYDCSHKICPGQMSANNWEAWNNFKSELQKSLSGNSVTPVSPSVTPTPSSNGNILSLQKSLNMLKFTDASGKALVEDGIAGNNTTNAVKRCQNVFGLKQDGVAGQITLSCINHILTKPTL